VLCLPELQRLVDPTVCIGTASQALTGELPVGSGFPNPRNGAQIIYTVVIYPVAPSWATLVRT